MYIYIYIYIYEYNIPGRRRRGCLGRRLPDTSGVYNVIIIITTSIMLFYNCLGRQLPDAFGVYNHTCHIRPPSEIDLGLCLAVFAGSGGKYLFHRIG